LLFDPRTLYYGPVLILMVFHGKFYTRLMGEWKIPHLDVGDCLPLLPEYTICLYCSIDVMATAACREVDCTHHYTFVTLERTGSISFYLYGDCGWNRSQVVYLGWRRCLPFSDHYFCLYVCYLHGGGLGFYTHLQFCLEVTLFWFFFFCLIYMAGTFALLGGCIHLIRLEVFPLCSTLEAGGLHLLSLLCWESYSAGIFSVLGDIPCSVILYILVISYVVTVP
jgi:hypothetical protein